MTPEKPSISHDRGDAILTPATEEIFVERAERAAKVSAAVRSFLADKTEARNPTEVRSFIESTVNSLATPSEKAVANEAVAIYDETQKAFDDFFANTTSDADRVLKAFGFESTKKVEWTRRHFALNCTFWDRDDFESAYNAGEKERKEIDRTVCGFAFSFNQPNMPAPHLNGRLTATYMDFIDPMGMGAFENKGGEKRFQKHEEEHCLLFLIRKAWQKALRFERIEAYQKRQTDERLEVLVAAPKEKKEKMMHEFVAALSKESRIQEYMSEEIISHISGKNEWTNIKLRTAEDYLGKEVTNDGKNVPIGIHRYAAWWMDHLTKQADSRLAEKTSWWTRDSKMLSSAVETQVYALLTDAAEAYTALKAAKVSDDFAIALFTFVPIEEWKPAATRYINKINQKT